jgi:UDP-N-acetylmuramoyl-L-alanyl-D-glutamate--2,6-diaminopimelate ligase
LPAVFDYKMMLLRELLRGVEVIQADGLEVSVCDVSYYAHDVGPGWVFVACDLSWMNGYEAIPAVIKRGGRVIVTDKKIDLPASADNFNIKVVIVRNSLLAYSAMCANLSDNAHRHLSIIAVTGTKGKTTTCHLIESIYRHADIKIGLISTIVRKMGPVETPSGCTTPDPRELHLLLKNMHSSGTSHVVIESSSIGIVEERLSGLKLQGALFTNLGTDHLTYHNGPENYRLAKSRLFTPPLEPDVCAINLDDPFGARLASIATGEVITYGRNGQVRYSSLTVDQHGICGNVLGVNVRSKLLGTHNATNILGAIALTRRLGIPADSISEGIAALNAVAGRLQRVVDTEGADIYIDYAHTPESVLTVLEFLNQIYAGRKIVVVVGCSGGTDKAKRPVIGQIAINNSNTCIVTSDNPRREDPLDIISDMIKDLPRHELTQHGRLEVQVDRREAIYRGVMQALEGAVLVILGKGHETVQEIGEEAVYFDDYYVANEALNVLRGLRIRNMKRRPTDGQSCPT